MLPTYLVEAYVPKSHAEDAAGGGHRVSAAAEQVSTEGMPIRYVRTTFLPDDETCFHVLEAATAAAVEEVCRRAALGRVRVVFAIESFRPAV